MHIWHEYPVILWCFCTIKIWWSCWHFKHVSVCVNRHLFKYQFLHGSSFFTNDSFDLFVGSDVSMATQQSPAQGSSVSESQLLWQQGFFWWSSGTEELPTEFLTHRLYFLRCHKNDDEVNFWTGEVCRFAGIRVLTQKLCCRSCFATDPVKGYKKCLDINKTYGSLIYISCNFS